MPKPTVHLALGYMTGPLRQLSRAYRAIKCSCHDPEIVGLSPSNTAQKATIHELTAMLATSNNILFTGHTHLQTTGTDNHSEGSSVPVVSRWL